MGFLKDLASAAKKTTEAIDDLVEATGAKDIVKNVTDYVDDTLNEIKDAVKGDKEEKE